MALKSKITKAEFDALNDVLKAEYKEQNGSYVLDTDEAEELRTANAKARKDFQDEKERADKLQRERDEANAEKIAAEEAKAKRDKDIPAIEASWQRKVEEATAKGNTEVEKLRVQLNNLLVDNKAIELANKISVSPKLILPHIKARLTAELDGDKPITRVLDADGKPSALSLDDLEKEFVANKEFSSIIKGSNATGGGASGQHSVGGADKKLSDMTEAERTALAKSNPIAFQQLSRAAGAPI